MRTTVYRDEARDMAEAHGQGHHDEIRRDGCPECEGRELRDYPVRPETEALGLVYYFDNKREADAVSRRLDARQVPHNVGRETRYTLRVDAEHEAEVGQALRGEAT